MVFDKRGFEETEWRASDGRADAARNWVNREDDRESERCFDLEAKGDASAAGRLLIELPNPFRGQGFEDEAFGPRPGDDFEPGAPIGEE